MIIEKILLGMSLAAPIGPVSIEIIRRSLTMGLISALTLCIGAVIGDTIFMLMAYYGISTFITNSLKLGILGLIGSLFLLYMGSSYIKQGKINIDLNNVDSSKKGILASISLGVALAVVNPISLAFWVGIFAASMVGTTKILLLPNFLIIVGVMIWSVFLCLLLASTKVMLSNRAVNIISKGASVLLLLYGFKYFHAAITELVKAI